MRTPCGQALDVPCEHQLTPRPTISARQPAGGAPDACINLWWGFFAPTAPLWQRAADTSVPWCRGAFGDGEEFPVASEVGDQAEAPMSAVRSEGRLSRRRSSGLDSVAVEEHGQGSQVFLSPQVH